MPINQDNDLKQQEGRELAEQAIAIRNRRKLVEERWLKSRRAWMNIDLERRFVSSDSAPGNYSIPAARRAAERTIIRCIDLLTPNVKWFEASPLNDVASDKLSNIDTFMWYVLRKRIKSRTNIAQLARSMVLYGPCHLKTSIAVRNGQVWPSQRVVDPFAFYIFPETTANIDEAELIFEDFLFSYERYRTFVQKGIVDDIPRSDITAPDWPYHLTERLAWQGITSPTDNIQTAVIKVGDELQKTTSAFVSMTEMWLTKNDKLYQVYIAWNCVDGPRCVGFFESLYDEPLYRSVTHRSLAGESYTNSMMEDISDLNSLQNDLINQFVEAVDWEQGFIAMSSQQRHDSWKAKGRSIWLTTDDPRNQLNLIAPPNTSNNQLRAYQIALGLINSLAGVGTIGEGQPGRNMPRAGNAVSGLINLAMADVKDMAELIEQEVLTPSLSDIYKVARSFIPEDQLMRIPGAKALYDNKQSSVLKGSDITGDYEFEWVGSLQSQNDSARSQQLLIFLNMIPVLGPFLQQQGYAFDVVNLTRMIWRYGLGERGLSDILVRLSDLQQTTQQEAVEDTQKQQGSNGTGKGMAGLKYNLPTSTSGFVQQ